VARPAAGCYGTVMTPAQCRAARGLLNWDHSRLAAAANVETGSIRDFEDEKGAHRIVVQTLQRALERAGVEFTDDGAPGVRQRPTPRVLSVDELNASNDE